MPMKIIAMKFFKGFNMSVLVFWYELFEIARHLEVKKKFFDGNVVFIDSVQCIPEKPTLSAGP